MDLLEKYIDIKQIKQEPTLNDELKEYLDRCIGRPLTRESFLIVEQGVRYICHQYYPDHNVRVDMSGEDNNISNIRVDIEGMTMRGDRKWRNIL